ncbi:MAG: homoserine kinase [Bacteroidetes bacterium]|nr:homoserine kinase [Bacteroidota bacterium]
MQPGIKVFAPASVGNAAVGFDVMGFALEQPGDEVIVRFSDTPGLRITLIAGAQGKLSSDPQKNTAGLAALKLLEHLGETGRGIEMELHKKMPIGSGLGSSAASAVAGAMAINELLKRPLEKKDLLPFALQGEYLASGGWHADNVAPSLMGGLVLIRDNETMDFHRLPVPHGIYATVIYPHVEVLTKDARSILSDAVPLKKFIQQNANLGAFIIGLYRSDIALIGRALQDAVIEPQRARLIPHFYAVKEAALKAGALGCSISGAGPSIFALSANSLIAEEVREAMRQVYFDSKIEYDSFMSPINQEGAVKL